MIFIHQSSECIKIQPTDIQPDIFSYLLHIMYTGMGPKQPVDQGRLQEGIKFLHAYRLYRTGSESSQDSDAAKMSNLYGIQISSQSATKNSLGLKEGQSRSLEEERSSGQAERPQIQLSLAVGLEGTSSDRQLPNLCGSSSGASWEDTESSSIPLRVKQERVETEVAVKPQTVSPVPAQESPSPGRLKDSPRVLYCHYCGERCCSRQGLREHLFAHATSSLPFGVPAAILQSNLGEVSKAGEEELEGLEERHPLQGCLAEKSPSRPEQPEAAGLEEALQQSQALSEELAELKGAASPHSRKRKIACAICSLRFTQKSQLQEHMYTHTGKHTRYHRYNRFCSQLIQASQHFCENQAEFTAEDAAKDTQDNVSSCYSLDSEISQESIDTVVVE
ncbi:zinc finger and BTB domain-containing protein 25-like isoform X2 [Megalops cyprinoides]|nr:zinc finger and BTB domain-containing protein 25-like isoform X2 [Megalops cyprinoides]